MTESAITPAPAPERPTAMLVSSAAIDAAVALGKEGVETLERLHKIHQEERAHAAKAEWARAMAALRAEMPPVVKSATGQHGVTRDGARTKGMYAPLDTITRTLDPLAAKHGITYRFDREERGGKDYVVCFVSHEAGHTESSRFPAPSDTGPGRNAIQAIASGETYAKRYALLAAFGITTADPDDDAEASGAAQETITEEQAANLQALLTEIRGDKGSFLRMLRVEALADIPASKYAAAMAALEAKRKAGGR